MVSPLDLQTLYSNLKNIGQQQAAERAAELATQDKQAEESARKADEKDHKVGQAPDVETGIEKVDEKEKKKREGTGAEHKKKPDEESEKKKQKYYEDPDIGHHVDISG